MLITVDVLKTVTYARTFTVETGLAQPTDNDLRARIISALMAKEFEDWNLAYVSYDVKNIESILEPVPDIVLASPLDRFKAVEYGPVTDAAIPWVIKNGAR